MSGARNCNVYLSGAPPHPHMSISQDKLFIALWICIVCLLAIFYWGVFMLGLKLIGAGGLAVVFWTYIMVKK